MRSVKDIEEIIKLHKDGYSYNEIAKLKDVTKSIVAYYCNLKRNNNIIERLKRGDELRCEYEKIVCDAISECNNIYQVCLKLNKRPTNTNIRYVEDIITKYNVSTEHFSLCGVQSGKHMKKNSDEEVFTKRNKFFNTTHLKKRLFERGYKPYRCEICGVSEWNGKALSLQIHHINGDNCDNRLENLQVLCPNCHSQTENFCRKCKKVKSTNGCCECGKTTIISHKHEVERPSFDELKTMIYTMSFVEIGKKYGVSDNCIRKWCKKCGLPHTKQEIRNAKKK